MIQKTALAAYRALVLTGLGSVVGAIGITVVFHELGVLRVPRPKTAPAPTEPKTTYC